MDARELILDLKSKRNAIILAHNYCLPEVQDISDFVGDSLALAIQASKTNADVIVFCGVRFMAEGAKILNPEKTVLMPEPDALCPMASMCSSSQLDEIKLIYPHAAVVGYVNSTADSKTRMDICCTSANAVKVVDSLEENQVIFAPDANLGAYVQSQCPDKKIILWKGYCPTHQAISKNMLEKLHRLHPRALILLHPECRPEVLEMADYIGSTAGILDYVRLSEEKEFIIGTEIGMLHPLSKNNPDKIFYAVDAAVCPMMKMTSLDSILQCLQDMSGSVELDLATSSQAHGPLKKMLDVKR